MAEGPELLLIGAVAVVGVLHTIVPDHWVPITLMARQRGWSNAETARAALLAGTGHVVSTLLIAVIAWLAGAALAARFGSIVDAAASLALVAFGGVIAVSAWREARRGGHSHGHHDHHAHVFPDDHAPEQAAPAGLHGARPLGHDHGDGWHVHDHDDHDDDHHHAPAWAEDALYAPLGGTAVLERHVHPHRHGQGRVHVHWHDHATDSLHAVSAAAGAAPPAHVHRHKTTGRMLLVLILGSSPMVEGIPAFFAAGRYGAGLVAVMAAVFALATIATYVLLCVVSVMGLDRVKLGRFERHGEMLSGALIALIGLAFWFL